MWISIIYGFRLLTNTELVIKEKCVPYHQIRCSLGTKSFLSSFFKGYKNQFCCIKTICFVLISRHSSNIPNIFNNRRKFRSFEFVLDISRSIKHNFIRHNLLPPLKSIPNRKKKMSLIGQKWLWKQTTRKLVKWNI